jgi:uncharacterized membrane protein
MALGSGFIAGRRSTRLAQVATSTSNWAITVVGAMLSVSLSTSTAHHGVLLFAMVLVLLLLVIESRRYRFFDVYRARVRRLEREYFARAFSPSGEIGADWMHLLSDDLKKPVFLMGYALAFSRNKPGDCWDGQQTAYGGQGLHSSNIAQ